MQVIKHCPSAKRLTGYLRGNLPAEEVAGTEQHLEVCPSCRERLEQLAGSSQLWQEAKDMLPGMNDFEARTGDCQSSALREKPESRDAGIETYLISWLGPTDDPTKLGRVGPYEVVGVVGYGGAGVVLKAHDARLNRYVAIKALLPALAHNAAARKRFERESRAVAAIVHQNVVPIYAVDVFNGHPYIAMQYVAGASLQQRLNTHGPLQVTEIVRIAAQTARALAAAHTQGVVHRDIKPANILLESNVDRVLVADFGLAQVIDDASWHSGLVAGTPQFMSPEQCQGLASDHRSDLFSLGSVMYAMCVGRPPFRAETLMGLIRKVCEATPRSVRELNPDVPEWLEAFIFLLLEKQPEDRFYSAHEIAEILEAELAHLQNPSGVAAPSRDWMPPADIASIASTIPRRALMTLSALTVVAALFFSLAQVENNEPNQTQPAQNLNSHDADTAVTVAKDDNGETIHQSTILREFDVKPGGKLALEDSDADIDVLGSNTSKVRIKVSRRVLNATSEESAREMLENHQVEFQSKQNTVTVQGKLGDALEQISDNTAQLLIHYEVSVPKQFHAQLTASDGNISLADLEGNLQITTSDGNLQVANIAGDLIAKTSDGDSTLSNCEGNLQLTTSDGDANLRDCKGSVMVSTSDGDVSLENCDGEIVAHTADGDINLKDCDGGTIVATAHDGEVNIENCSGVFQTNGHMELKSSNGASISF